MTSRPPPVAIGEFEGPLDLLLEEVRKQNIPVQEIQMAPLVARFLEYVHCARDRSLNLNIEWLLLAATLIQWKSRSLLPETPAELAKPDLVRDELVRQLLAHKKELAEELGKRKTVADASLSRSGAAPVPDDCFPGEEPEPSFVSVWDLTQQARELAHWVAEYRVTLSHWVQTFDVESESVTVAEMCDALRQYLGQAETLPVDALPLIAQQPTRAHLSALFLGLLEMVRNQELTVEQTEEFTSVWVNLGESRLICSSLLQDDSPS